MEGTNDLQFSLTVEVLTSNNSKNSSLCRRYKYQPGKTVSFAVARCMAAENGFKQVVNHSVNCSQVLR